MKPRRILAFFIVGILFYGTTAAEQKRVVALGHAWRESAPIPLLQREIIRQSILTSYREDQGFLGRDLVIGTPLDTQNDLSLETVISLIEEGKISIALRDTTSNAIRWEVQLDRHDYIELLEVSERIASAQLPKSSAAPTHKPIRVEPKSSIDSDSEAISDLLILLRETHSLHSAKATPETYERLIRGYAHLGLRSSHLWAPAYKAYQARSLVYAQRYIRTAPNKAFPFFLRAYALGLCGLHADALSDIKIARTLSLCQEPEWVGILEDVLEFDTDSLVEIANSDSQMRRTAALLAMVTLEYTPFDSRVFNTYGRIKPHALVDIRLISQLNEAGGVSSMHKTTTEGFNQMSTWVLKELPGHPLLPAPIASQYSISTKKTLTAKATFIPINAGCNTPTSKWQELDYIPQMQAVLAAETISGRDQAEPSLAAYGHLLEENMFAVAIWRQHFMQYWWSVDIDEFTKEALPFIRNHPYHKLLEAKCAEKHGSSADVEKLLSELEIGSLPGGANLFFSKLYDSNADYGSHSGEQLRKRYLKELDYTHADTQRAHYIVEKVEKRNKATCLPLAERITKTSPNSPFGQRELITNAKNWRQRIEKLPPTEELAPETAQIIAYRYRKAKEFEKAIPYYEAAIEKAPDEPFLYERLALNYKRMGNEDKWLETMMRALELPDTGLNRASIQCDIAKVFMRKKEIGKARAYAEDAARCGSSWALRLAEECAFIDGDKKRARDLLVKIHNRYHQDNQPWAAYFHALVYEIPETDPWRMGIEARTKASLSKIKPSTEENVYIGYYHWSNGSPELAAASYHTAYKATDNIIFAMSEALAHLDAGNETEFLNTLQRIIHNNAVGSRNAHIRKIAGVMKESYLNAPPAEELYKTMLELKKGPLEVPDYYFFTGKFLSLLNNEEEAIQLFYRGIIPVFSKRGAGLFCCIELISRGQDPFAKYKGGIPPYIPSKNRK